MIVRPTRSKEATDFLYRKCDTIDIGPSLRMIEAVDENGKILGVAGFSCWMDLTCLVHVAVDAPSALLPLVCAGADYVFGQLRLTTVIAIARAERIRWVAGLKMLGFKELSRIKGGSFNSKDLIILEAKLPYINIKLAKRISHYAKRRRTSTPRLPSTGAGAGADASPVAPATDGC